MFNVVYSCEIAQLFNKYAADIRIQMAHPALIKENTAQVKYLTYAYKKTLLMVNQV